MRLKPYLTTILRFLGWMLHDLVHQVSIIRCLVQVVEQKEGVPAKMDS